MTRVGACGKWVKVALGACGDEKIVTVVVKGASNVSGVGHVCYDGDSGGGICSRGGIVRKGIDVIFGRNIASSYTLLDYEGRRLLKQTYSVFPSSLSAIP